MGQACGKPKFRGISLIVESYTTLSKLDGRISQKFRASARPALRHSGRQTDKAIELPEK